MEALIIVGVAVAVVLGTSVLKGEYWTARTKHLVATVLSVVGGAIMVLSSTDLNSPVELFTVIAAVHGSSQAIYNFLIKDTKVDEIVQHSILKN